MVTNDITVRLAKFQITFVDGKSYFYHHHPDSPGASSVTRRSNTIRAHPETTTIQPGDFYCHSPDYPDDIDYSLESRSNVKHSTKESKSPPTLEHPAAGLIRIPNLTDTPKVLRKNDHIGQLHPTLETSTEAVPSIKVCTEEGKSTCHSNDIKLDCDRILPPEVQRKFKSLHAQFDSVFDPKIQCYNGSLGPITGEVNMGPVLPPQRKGRVPKYSRDKLMELQHKFDELEEAGVFRRPEDLGIVAEYFVLPFYYLVRFNQSLCTIIIFNQFQL